MRIFWSASLQLCLSDNNARKWLLDQRLWHGQICVMVLASRRAQLRYNLAKVSGVLQATVKWGKSPLWPSSQALDKAIGVLMDGTMWCKLKSTWQNTPQKQPRSYMGTSFGSSCMMRMRNLFPRPLMMGMWM